MQDHLNFILLRTEAGMPLADNMQPILAKPAKQRSGFLKLHSSDNLFSWEQRIEFLKQFGTHSQHFTALQSGMQYFDVPGIGYQAYMQKWGRCMVLGDPVAEPLEHAAFLDEFLQKHGNASFIQVSEANASHLHARHAYYGTQFGKELKVPLSDWTVSGKSKKCIRKAINQAAEQGITVVESPHELNVDEVSSRWLGTRKTRHREILFMVRPRKMEYRENCRYFYAMKDGSPIGFAYFDPAYLNGKVVSYLPNISRGCPTFKQGLFYTIMAHAMDLFREEGISHLDLGLNPLALDDVAKPHECRIVRSIFGWTFKHCLHYNFSGLHFTKQRFGGNWSPTFYCHKNTLPAVDMARMLKLTRVL